MTSSSKSLITLQFIHSFISVTNVSPSFVVLTICESHICFPSSHGTLKLFTTTLDHILEEYKAPKNIDYLSLDIEGSEYRILKNFDFNKYNIKIISIERAFSIDKNNKSKEYINSKKLLQELLSNNNYKHIQSCGYDDMFIKE